MQCCRLNRLNRFCNSEAVYVFADHSGDPDVAAYIAVCSFHCKSLMSGKPREINLNKREMRYDHIIYYPTARIVDQHVVLEDQCYNLDGTAWTGKDAPLPWFRDYYAHLDWDGIAFVNNELVMIGQGLRTRIFHGLIEFSAYRKNREKATDPFLYDGRVLGGDRQFHVIKDARSVAEVRKACLDSLMNTEKSLEPAESEVEAGLRELVGAGAK